MMTSLSSERLLWAVLVLGAYLLMCAVIVIQQWRKHRAAQRSASALMPTVEGAHTWLIAYASQTGNAEQLAWQTGRLLHTAGVAARVMPLSQLQASDLQHSERALFIASTYGEGDPPDTAALFARRIMSGHLPLGTLHYGILALGDNTYKHFCGFGRMLDAWLVSCAAQPLFERIEVNNDDPTALANWRHQLSHLAGTDDLPDWQAPSYEHWTLHARQHLNPGSAGKPTFHLELQPTHGTLPDWLSGDLVQVLAPGDRQRAREYSIASIPADGSLHLLVRQEHHADGTLGVASGWLTDQAMPGDLIEVRLRPHHHFQLGDNQHRPMILIGNGTGLAGLRAHLKARAGNAARNWLIFGERNAASDAYYRDEIETWMRNGTLSRMNWVFSRDQAERKYVQDCLRECADDVRTWINDDAAIYVCGSLEGMASGVESALKDILGATQVDHLIESGRYRRDVY